MTVPTEPIAANERVPLGLDPFARPVFSFSPLEPAAGIMLQESGSPLLTEAGEFIALEPLE